MLHRGESSRDSHGRAIENGANPVFRELAQANAVFHLAVAAIARNQRICDQLKLVLEHVRRLDLLGAQKDPEWVPHHDILDALRVHNPDEARGRMAEYIDNSRNQMLRLFGGRI